MLDKNWPLATGNSSVECVQTETGHWHTVHQWTMFKQKQSMFQHKLVTNTLTIRQWSMLKQKLVTDLQFISGACSNRNRVCSNRNWSLAIHQWSIFKQKPWFEDFILLSFAHALWLFLALWPLPVRLSQFLYVCFLEWVGFIPVSSDRSLSN